MPLKFYVLFCRFKLNLVKTGSFYDDAKVTAPDEFDYVAELEPLSHNRSVEFSRHRRSCFSADKTKEIL